MKAVEWWLSMSFSQKVAVFIEVFGEDQELSELSDEDVQKIYNHFHATINSGLRIID